MVFPRSPSARRGVVKGALVDWKDFAAPKFLPMYKEFFVSQLQHLQHLI